MGIIGAIIAYAVIGLIGGAIAKAILPGKQGGGIWATMILGIIGALVFTGLASLIWKNTYSNIFSIPGLISAIIGALLVSIIWAAIQKRR